MVVVVILATDGRSYISTRSDYIHSHEAPRPHKQKPSTKNTHNGPVAPQWLLCPPLLLPTP